MLSNQEIRKQTVVEQDASNAPVSQTNFLKVLGAGFGRTGTKSLRNALNILKYNTHHMENVLMDPTQKAEIFENAYKHPEDPVDWIRAYQGYNAAVDWPSTAFFDRLYKLNPDAKVILTIRDPEDWHRSVCRTIHEWPAVDDTWPKQILKARKMARVVVRDGELGGENIEGRKDELVEKFKKHIEHVKSIVKPENLLIMELGNGWKELCPFLGIDIPEGVEYPYENKGDNFKKLLESVKETVIKANANMQEEVSTQ
ncbi:P-loop containing nucleoside triphosphate hydrolase protein [Parasitella parasitica]|nr:P-loop containing nucleoside triphosphate hydrolase protein [Parasitella parasitica]